MVAIQIEDHTPFLVVARIMNSSFWPFCVQITVFNYLESSCSLSEKTHLQISVSSNRRELVCAGKDSLLNTPLFPLQSFLVMPSFSSQSTAGLELIYIYPLYLLLPFPVFTPSSLKSLSFESQVIRLYHCTTSSSTPLLFLWSLCLTPGRIQLLAHCVPHMLVRYINIPLNTLASQLF